jgi:hypothetical protein
MRVFVLLAAVILVAGLTDLGLRLLAEIRAIIRSRAAKRMIARTLKTSVQRANAQQAVAALRLSPKVDIEPLENEATRGELLQRIETLRVRALALSNSRHGVEKHPGRNRQIQGHSAETFASGTGVITMPERRSPAAPAIPELVLLDGTEARSC